jgi:ribosomal-protein-alanine N-acetyltransferase
VLSIGIVVDDAIVVVENVERWIKQGLSPREAAGKAIDEVTGPVIGVAAVLSAVFVPCGFIGGVTGLFFRQLAWSEEDFLCWLRQRNCIGMVAERQERIVGFMIYELLKSQLHVLNFAVTPWARRQAAGSQMVEKLVNKLSQQRRQEICLEVRETNLAAQLFFRNQGLQANGVLCGHFEDTEEDAYVVRYQLYPCDDHILPFVPKNRIADIGNDQDAEAA